MTINSQTLRFEARRISGVGVIHTQLASSYANAPQELASSPSTVGFITHDFHALISQQHSQTNRRGLYALFLTSKSRCMQKISSVDALLTTKKCCPDPVASAVAISDEANCSWLHQSHHCDYLAIRLRPPKHLKYMCVYVILISDMKHIRSTVDENWDLSNSHCDGTRN